MNNARSYLQRYDEILQEMAQKMLSIRPINNVTINFIRGMIPHHEAAISMCQNLLQYTNNIALQNLARNIIRVQAKEIDEMRDIARQNHMFPNPLSMVQMYLNTYYSITRGMISRMANALRLEDVNLDFISEMIPHHEGAIAMCENVLKYDIDPRLRLLANAIIEEQSKNIQELERIRSTLIQR